MKKQMTILILTAFTLIYTALPAYSTTPSAPRVSVYYSDEQSTTVAVTLTWEVKTGVTYTAFYANSMNSAGSEPNYSPVGIASTGKTVKVVLEKYKNYFFKVVAREGTDEAASNVRVFPVNTGGNRKTNENAHGNYTDNTASCAWCHTNHSSLKAQLLNETTYYQLCKLCHGTASTQSKYDVERGQVTMGGGETKPSLAGPFVEGVTSSHNADDSAQGWGAVEVPGSDPGKKLSMTCVSCHDVHAKTDDNYRMLKKTIYASDGETEGDKIKTENIDYKAFAVTPADPSYPFGEELFMVKGNTEFCSSCHLNYDDGDARNPGRDSRLDMTVSQSVYMHPSSRGSTQYSVLKPNGTGDYKPSPGDVLPLQYNPVESSSGDKRTAVVCSTCHYAHGTVKKFDTPEGQNKNILRLDNYGTCESCHKK